MKPEKKNLHTASSLRKKAENKLANKSTQDTSLIADIDIKRVIHELQVHQVELEMQNEELRESMDLAEAATEKYTKLYDFAPVGYFTLDQSGLITDLNLNGARMLGKDKVSLIGTQFLKFVSRENHNIFSEFYTKILESGSKQTCNLRLSHRDKPSIYCHLEGICSESRLCLIAAIDITEQHQAEDILTENEARLVELNATKDKFFSIIAHDLRGPFNAIIGFAGLLREKIQREDYKEAGKYAEFIQESSYRAMSLLMNLLQWARLQTGKIKFNPEKIRLSEIIDEVTDLLKDAAQQKSITLNKELPENIHFIADKEMISNVIRNLVSNAVKFTNPGGKISISASRNQKELTIMVSDTGIGIEKSKIEKLFRIEGNQSAKGTRDEEGTGLGLILCKEFVSKHGGEIWVESESGEGSSFCFTVPQPEQYR